MSENLIQEVEAWFKKVFISAQTKGDQIAIAITEDVQAALKSGIVDGIAEAISATFPSVKNIPETLVADLKVVVPKILAAELALQGLPANPAPADIQAFANSVAAAFNVNTNNSKLWTTFAAQVYAILQQDTTSNFASLVADVEQAYQDLQADQAS